MRCGNCMSQELGRTAGVAHALLRAVSRLVSTPAPLYDAASEPVARTGVEKSLDAARRSACATVAAKMAHPNSMTSGCQSLDAARKSACATRQRAAIRDLVRPRKRS